MGEIAVVEPLASAHDASVGTDRVDLRDGVVVARDRLGVDHGSHPMLANGGIPDAEVHRVRVQRRDEVVEHRVLDVHARAGGALLSRQAERRARDSGRRDEDVGMAVTIAAFLPPISAIHGRGQAPCASERTRCIPTAELPVNVTPATSECRISASPNETPGPVT
jgi:hypothetical protein